MLEDAPSCVVETIQSNLQWATLRMPCKILKKRKDKVEEGGNV